MARVAGRSMSREEVADAAWRVIVRDGLHRTSVRAIAQELDATTGVVTYHFRDKAELMLFALDRLGAAILRDLDDAVAGAHGLDRIRRILEVTIPLGQRQAIGWRIWVAFVGVALTNKRLRDEHQRRLEILSQRLTEELEALVQGGVLPDRVDARFEADALIALSDGIGLGFVLRPTVYSPERQLEIVDRYLADRFGPLAAPERRTDSGREPNPATSR